MTTCYKPLNYDEINSNKCMGRMISKPNQQCSRYPKQGGLCNSCYKRSISKNLVLITETWEKPTKCKKIVSRKTEKKPVLIKINDVQPSSYNKKVINITNLKHTLNYYKIEFRSNEKKLNLLNKIIEFYKPFVKYNDNIDTIRKFQKLWKSTLKNRIVKMRGPGFLNRKLCVNDTDFYTCDDIDDIPDEQFFSYEYNKTIYGFDIRSFDKLLKMCEKKQNPYDKHKIPDSVIKNFNKLYMNSQKILQKIVEPTFMMTPAQLFDQELLRVFDIYDNLKYYTDIEWFKKLSLNRLRRFYLEVQDIWRYRAGLTNVARNNIVPDGNTLLLRKYELYKLNITQLRKTMLKEMENFATLGATNSDKVLGALFMITGLVIVSPRARLAYPDLWQTPAI